MLKKEATFGGVNGAELFYRVFTPGGTPKAAVIAVHGHGDHSGGLQNLLHQLAEHGYITYAFDLRGHGKSSGKRGFIRSWEEFRGDLHEFRKLVQAEHPDLPVFLVLHSLGGLIGLDYALYYGKGLAGLVAIAPAVSYEMTPIEKFLSTLVSKIKPDYAIEPKGDIDLLTQDPDIQARLQSDELRHNKATAGLGKCLLQTVQNLTGRAPSIKLPFLLQYGLDDRITPPAKLREFFASIGSRDKQKLEYANMRHRPFDDIGREQCLTDMVNWLDRQAATR